MTNLYELAKKIEYKYKKIKYLKQALFTELVIDKNDGENRKNYTNQALATLGDSILKFFITEKLFSIREDKQYITKRKAELENNSLLKDVSDYFSLYTYAHNKQYSYFSTPDHKKLPNPEHDFYLEAVIGAIYLDRGIKYTKKWLDDVVYKVILELAENKERIHFDGAI